MLYARDLFGFTIEAAPGGRGVCPACGATVIAKCGSIKIWHWAHERSSDCDHWSEGESEWHLSWKRGVPPERQEVVIGPHRADVMSPRGVVVELQNSPISVEEIREREAFYGNMVWLFNARSFAKHFSFRPRKIRDKSGCAIPVGYNRFLREDPLQEIAPGVRYRSFRWKHPRRSILSCRKPTFLDIGITDGFGGVRQIFEMDTAWDGIPCGGFGRMMNEINFRDRYFNFSESEKIIST